MTNGLHWAEIEKLRVRQHDLAQKVTANTNDLSHLPDRVAALEASVNRFKGMVAVAAGLSAVIGALLAKLI